MKVFKIVGKVVNSDTKEGIKGLRVEAWDKDLLVNDMVGSAITGEGGVFRVQFDESYFKELFIDCRPDLFFKVFKGTRLIKSTEDSVLWNVEREDIEQTIEVEEVNDMTTPKNKAVFVRQRGSEVFKFVTLRPFQRQDETTVEKRKVLCYKPIDEEKSEFHQALLHAKEQPPESCGPREAMVAKAKEFIETDGSTFVRNIHDLSNPQAPRSSQYTGYKSSLGLLEEWIFRAKKPISHEDMLSEIKNAYKKDNINDIVQSPEFQTDIYWLQDSIMALAIVPSYPHSQRDRLVNALRICRIIERMAESDAGLMQSYGTDKAMKAPVVLPTDIFPLPTAQQIEIKALSDQDRKREEELRKLRKKRNALKTAIEELAHLRTDDYVSPPQPPAKEPLVLKLKKDDIEKLSDSTQAILEELGIDLTMETITEVMSKLEAERDKVEEAKAREIQSAMEELLKLSTSQLPKPTERPAEKEIPAVAEQWKPWTLRQEAIDRLHDTTRQVIQDLGLDLTRDQMPYVVNAFEKELAKVGAKLFRPPMSKRIIRRGVSRMEFLPGLEVSPWPQDILEPIRVPQTKGLVQPVGVGEYNTVRQTLLSYEPGEIAHIENVLRGEYKERVHRRLRRLEEEITYEEERKAVTEKDLQSTDRFELKREASETIKEEHKAEAGVAIKYDGPTVDVEANAGYTYTHAKKQSKKTSVSYAREVTEKSLSRLEEKVREVRVEKTIEEFEETNTHGIDNKDKPDHAVGIYRWVDKIYEAQVIGYGERLFFDFVIPEPAAFYLYALTHGATMDLEEPVPPMVDENEEPCSEPIENCRFLKPKDIDTDNYMAWAARYSVSGLEPLPSRYVFVSKTFNEVGEREGNDKIKFAVEQAKYVKIPDGYNVVRVRATGYSHNTNRLVTIIDDYIHEHGHARAFWQWKEDYPPEGNNYQKLDDSGLPVAISIGESTGFIMNVVVMCIRNNETDQKWQLKTYDAIMQAYLNKKAEYEEKLAMAAIQEGISISGRNPEQNREIEETELKRCALSMITGQYFELFNAMQTDRQGYPGIDFAEAETEGSYIQFFEQAFEWPLMTYLFYPYFWGSKRQATWEGGPTWIDKITGIQDVDPLFEKFLKAGASRITVPVRPGFEDAIMHYLSTTEIWNGSEKPTLDEDLYLSIVEEIQQQQGAYVEKSEGTISVENGNAQVVGTGTNFEESDVDREIYVESKRYIIAEVQDTEHLTLIEPYRGETKQHARYYIGARLVGGPWEVRIPTSLVYLQQDATPLPDFEEE
jgi:hypothetical protein